jgi:hypothetical protein
MIGTKHARSITYMTVKLLIAILPFILLTSSRGSSDSGGTNPDTSRAYSQGNDHRYSMVNNEILRLICPILDIRVSYPFLISLETGVILNVTVSDETEHYDPINGPAVFTEISYPGIIAGLGANFGKISDQGITFVRPELCYSRIWTNRFFVKNRGQYLGVGITGSLFLFKASFRIFHSACGHNSKEYLPYFGLGFGF